MVHTHRHTDTHRHTQTHTHTAQKDARTCKVVVLWAGYQAFFNGENSIGDLSNFEQLKKKLQCADFSAYIQRFSYVFIDGGLVSETWHSFVPISNYWMHTQNRHTSFVVLGRSPPKQRV